MSILRNKFFLPVLISFTVLSTLFAAFFFYQYVKVRTVDPNAAINDVVKKVSKLAVLPEGETPTLATVSDKDKLTTQDFFSKAENGDKVLVYLKAEKAYLYRPQINKIIDIAPVRNVSGKNVTESTLKMKAVEEKSVPGESTIDELPVEKTE